MTASVLVVDDDAALRRALSRVLRAFDFVAADTATEAVRILSERPFDAILTDFGIPPMDGVGLLKHAAASYPGMRRYLMSGFDGSRFAEHVSSTLILRVFSKPLDLDALRAELAGAAPALP